jgi:hypothetical protein
LKLIKYFLMNSNNTDTVQAKNSIKPIVLGILILLLQIGILFAYGFAGQFSTMNVTI